LINNLKDRKSLEIKEMIERIAPMNSNVLIFGETGVGKDFWVNYLFRLSKAPVLVDLNCGDVPEHLLESEWFGYRKGAFTGADRDFEGKWQKAGEGILYLNQIDLLSLNLQARLLRIIERKKYFPLGSNEEIDIKARFIFSADQRIEARVRTGEFRSDLYFRISSCSLFIPPLRERKGDILPLVNFFAGQKGVPIDLTPAGCQGLLAYHWSGNIRELENFLTQQFIRQKPLEDDDVDSLLKNVHDFWDMVKEQELPLAVLEKKYIDYLLKKHRNKKKVAEILKISRKSLYNKLGRWEAP